VCGSGCELGVSEIPICCIQAHRPVKMSQLPFTQSPSLVGQDGVDPKVMDILYCCGIRN